jgi:hypothetical protein
MTNKEYIKLCGTTGYQAQIMEIAMDKYGDNKWWLDKCITRKAFYQLFEEILIIQYDDMQDGLTEFFGRKIEFSDMQTNIKNIRNEALKILAEMGIRNGDF